MENIAAIIAIVTETAYDTMDRSVRALAEIVPHVSNIMSDLASELEKNDRFLNARNRIKNFNIDGYEPRKEVQTKGSNAADRLSKLFDFSGPKKDEKESPKLVVVEVDPKERVESPVFKEKKVQELRQKIQKVVCDGKPATMLGLGMALAAGLAEAELALLDHMEVQAGESACNAWMVALMTETGLYETDGKGFVKPKGEVAHA